MPLVRPSVRPSVHVSKMGWFRPPPLILGAFRLSIRPCLQNGMIPSPPPYIIYIYLIHNPRCREKAHTSIHIKLLSGVKKNMFVRSCVSPPIQVRSLVCSFVCTSPPPSLSFVCTWPPPSSFVRSYVCPHPSKLVRIFICTSPHLQENGIWGQGDLAKMGFGENGIWGKWHLGKMGFKVRRILEKCDFGKYGFWESGILPWEVSGGSPCMRGMRSERSEPLRAREESQPAGLE